MQEGVTVERLKTLSEKQRRGSRARSILLTEGTPEEVAQRLSSIVAPHAQIDPRRHRWFPQGFSSIEEAKLGETIGLVGSEQREKLTNWWLAKRRLANTPNWDIACTATLESGEGLVLIEAKAHANEIGRGGKLLNGNKDNHEKICAAVREANEDLSRSYGGWALTTTECYQLCNRFAWSWKVASLGIPVLLVYLGFLVADEMVDQGAPLKDHTDWERLVRAHGKSIVPDDAWDRPFSVSGTNMRAIIRSVLLTL
jgi:hypothetical protein